MDSDWDGGDSGRDGVVVTKSRFRMLWLRLVRGYKIRNVARIPQQDLFGQITYTPKWTLERKK